jgi:hypothetical protein
MRHEMNSHWNFAPISSSHKNEFLCDALPNIQMDGKKVVVFGVGYQQVRTFDFLNRLNVLGHGTLPSIFFYEVTRN